MTRIGLLSDTHGYLDPVLEQHFNDCSEIWHAGDIGDAGILDTLVSWGKAVRAVYGNIDPADIRRITVEDLHWKCEDLDVFMTHIAGYPGRYNHRVREIIAHYSPGMVVCGHSHILKVIYDKALVHLHLNPGACGRQGTHQVRTALRFTIDGVEVRDMQILELGKRGHSDRQ
jgi:putative phosphoesterase